MKSKPLLAKRRKMSFFIFPYRQIRRVGFAHTPKAPQYFRPGYRRLETLAHPSSIANMPNKDRNSFLESEQKLIERNRRLFQISRCFAHNPQQCVGI